MGTRRGAHCAPVFESIAPASNPSRLNNGGRAINDGGAINDGRVFTGGRAMRAPTTIERDGICRHPNLSELGEIVEQSILNIPQIYDGIFVDQYVIMPNHVHLILRIDVENGRVAHNNGRVTHNNGRVAHNGRAMRAPTISTVVNQMKGYATKQIGYSIWQKSFHDHIIRNEQDYIRIAEYIENNPINWENDCFYTGK